MSEPADGQQPETMHAGEIPDATVAELRAVETLAVPRAYSQEPDEPADVNPPSVARVSWWRADLIAVAMLAAAAAIIAAILFVPSINDVPAAHVVSRPSTSQVVTPPATVTVTQPPPAPAAAPPPPVVAPPPPPPPAAPPPPLSNEARLTKELTARGFESGDPAGMAGAARRVCAYLASGASFDDVIDAAYSDVDTLSWDRRATLVRAMVGVYCPQYG